MKSSVRKFRPELGRLMDEAREAIAAERFDPVRVKSELSAAAKEDRPSQTLVVQGPIDLRLTTAAQNLLLWCSKEGLRTDLLRGFIGDRDGNANWDLLISWRTPKV